MKKNNTSRIGTIVVVVLLVLVGVTLLVKMMGDGNVRQECYGS